MNEPQFTSVERKDPELAIAHSRAAGTINDFIGMVSRGTNVSQMAKLRFRDPDLSEQLGEDRFFFLWLNQVVYHTREKLLSGVFFEVPSGFEKWHEPGSRLGFGPEDVFDWMVIEERRMKGGFTVRLHRSRLPVDERPAYDAYIGVKFYDAMDL
jgi:uncharacterized protein YegJ (DUF2314 family)